MRWPWERSPEEKQRDRAETDAVIRQVHEAMDEVRETLDSAERDILKEINHGGHG